MVEQPLFGYFQLSSVTTATSSFNQWRFHKGTQIGSLIVYWIPRDHKPINAERIKGKEHFPINFLSPSLFLEAWGG